MVLVPLSTSILQLVGKSAKYKDTRSGKTKEELQQGSGPPKLWYMTVCGLLAAQNFYYFLE
jgi:hypothetical protein